MWGATEQQTPRLASVIQQTRNMDNEKYNGWTNRETWLIKLWIDNEQETHFYWRRVAIDFRNREQPDEAKRSVARRLQQTFETQSPVIKHGMYADLLSTAIARVEWFEIAEAMLDDLDEARPETSDDDSVVIYAYTRAHAIADGVLVDVSKLAAEAGFKYPVAMTSAAWAGCVMVPEGTDDQDETGRLWDVLNVLRFAIKGSEEHRSASDIRFTVFVRTGEVTSEDIELKSICGPGDDLSPVITIMLPNED